MRPLVNVPAVDNLDIQVVGDGTGCRDGQACHYGKDGGECDCGYEGQEGLSAKSPFSATEELGEQRQCEVAALVRGDDFISSDR